MASSLALRRVAASSSLFSKLTKPARPGLVAPSITRSFNTNTQMKRFENDESDVELDRRSDLRRDSGFFSDVWDPFSPTRSLSQILNQMDQLMENPFFTIPHGMGGASRRPWDVKEDNSGLYIRMNMPGLGKENVKVSIEQNTLVIKGQGEKESEDEDRWGRYSSRIDLPANTYRLGEIKAEMKNGVLKVTVPKVKEEERKDVFQVNVE